MFYMCNETLYCRISAAINKYATHSSCNCSYNLRYSIRVNGIMGQSSNREFRYSLQTHIHMQKHTLSLFFSQNTFLLFRPLIGRRGIYITSLFFFFFKTRTRVFRGSSDENTKGAYVSIILAICSS